MRLRRGETMEHGSSKQEKTQQGKQLPEESAEIQVDENIDRIIEETRQDAAGTNAGVPERLTPEINIIGIEKQEKKKFAKMKAANKKEKKIDEHNTSFAYGLNFYKLFWIFFIGSFIGVVVEVIFCLIVDHRYESRSGVIYGPFNPVYGFGAVVITMALYWLRNKRDIWVFICGGLLGAAFEYVCSWYQETFLGTVSWDYSNSFMNINGRTNLMYALFWGLLSIAWLKFIYPFMSRLIEKIPNKIGKGLTWVLVIFMALNCLISAAAVNRMSARYEGVPARSSFDVFLDRTYPDEFLTKIYTHMAYSDGTGTEEKLNPPKDGEPAGGSLNTSAADSSSAPLS